MSLAVSSPSPSTSLSSPKDSESSPSMAANDTDLGLDPSDPLNLWLHNTSQGSDSSMEEDQAGGSPPDWSHLSDLWTTSMESGGNTKLDFGLGLDTEMDFVNSMAIDPSALHLNYQEFSSPEVVYPFTFQPNELLASNEQLTPSHRERKLSVTSSSSSSGASFSSVSSPGAPSQGVAHTQENTLDPATELVQRVLQSAGLTLAVPAGAHNATNGTPTSFTSPTSSPTTSFTSPSQLSQMPVHAYSPQSSASSTSSAPSTPPPSTPPQTAMMLDPTMSMNHVQQAPVSSMGVISRPKTSHTTIERRYRTNLNARITSLRMAIPALRVLEDKDACNVGGGGKKGKNSTLGKAVVYGTKVKKENEDGTDVVDVIDERGFVDGVKVARKCSKANILGKAVEYIRVLKKREVRLKKEQDGLKQLVRGLVGGPALLDEWEREWRARFGGAEKDEVEGDEDDGGSDDEGSGDDDDDDDGGRKRKKPKLTPPPKKEVKEKKPPPPQPQPQVLPDGTVIMPEKRKRGRPRKVQPNAPAPGGQTLTFPAMTQQPPVQQQPYAQQSTQQPQQSQYLLAVFALFSFYNSPFSSPTHTSPNHSHAGTVLTHETAPVRHVVPGWTLHEVIQVFHLLVSALVFCSIVLPWLPSTKYFSLSYLSSLRTSYREHRRTRTNSRTTETRSALLRAALTKRGSADEAATLHDALRGDFSLTSLFGFAKKEKNSSYQQKGLEQSAWVRLGELCVLEGEVSIFNRALTFWHMRSHLSWFTCSAADLSTLALVLYPLCTLARRPAKALWEAARARKGYTGDQGRGVGVLIRPHERFVLETMEVDEAYATLKALQRTSSVSTRYSPIGLLASIVIKERSKKHLQKAFVRTISPPSEKSFELEDDSADFAKTVKAEEEEETEVRATVDAARSLGGEVADIGEMLESLWNLGLHELNWDLEEDSETGLDSDIRALATAIVLYRRIFSSSIMGPVGDGNGSAVSILLSPPPSPSVRDSRLQLALRKALGSSVFESGEGEDFGRALEDARDRVVDMLVESERACR